MSESAVPSVVHTGVEPPAILRVLEVAFAWADVGALRDGSDLRGAVAGRGLGGPHTNFPSLVKDQATWATVLKDRVVILQLVELHTSVIPNAIKS